MKQAFITKRFGASVRGLIEQGNVILREYAAKGYTMTLRQLHYQFVARGLYENTKQCYQRLGDAMSNGRLAGLVDWEHMEDRLRELDSSPRWKSPSDIIAACASQYQEDLWAGMPQRPEVWIEKDALAGVVDGICKELRCDLFACRGYVSQSAQYEAGMRLRRYISKGQEPIIFHLGDHDPSGIDMTRENTEKISLLAGRPVKVIRLALNFDQVQQYNPPPNMAKLTDSRAAGYVERYGNESWELDALDPEVLSDLVRNAIEPLIDRAIWQTNELDETSSQNEITDVSDNWNAALDGARS